MIKFAICDNEFIQIELLKNLIVDYCINWLEEYKIIEFYSRENLIQETVSDFDIVFISVKFIQNYDEIEFIQLIKEKNKDRIIIFINDTTNYTLEALNIYALQFILNPTNTDKFNLILKDAINSVKLSYTTIPIYDINKTLFLVKPNDIIYLKKENRFTKIITVNSEIYTNDTLKYWSNYLMKNGFIETCKGFLVNIRMIKRLEKEDCVMINDISIPISRRNQINIRRKIRDFLIFLNNKKSGNLEFYQ